VHVTIGRLPGWIHSGKETAEPIGRPRQIYRSPLRF
jgi:hypothetical protein